jgi:hypothetical protein
VLTTGCTPRYVTNWPLLSVGLTRGQVQAILGPPDMTWRSTFAAKIAASEPATRPSIDAALALTHLLSATAPANPMVILMCPEGWAYGVSMFDLFDSEHQYVVCFDSKGRLCDWRAPAQQ